MRYLALLQRLLQGLPASRGALCGLLAFFPALALAAPLDKNACAKLASDMQNMKALEVDKLMERGPAWAASHLSPADLSLVRQYIDLDEQMKFRCSAPSSLVHLKHLDEVEEEGGQPKTAATADDGSKKQQSGDGEEAAEKPKAAKAPAQEKRPQRDGRDTR